MRKNWKTTLLGLAAGVLNLVASGASWKSAAVSIGVAAVGAAAKDYSN